MNGQAQPKIDVHIHLAGTGCCDSGIQLSQWFRNRYTFRLLKWKLKISEHQMRQTIDGEWPQMISQMIAAGPLDFGVVLGFDGVFRHDDGCERMDKHQMSIPQDWVFQVCKRFPNLLPGPSINPFRKDALALLDDAIQRGAVLIKWLPCTQDIDPRHPKISEFYQLLSRAGVPLLVHMGGERTFHTVNHHLNDVASLEVPLQQGVKVICAHSATRIQFSREKDQLPTLRELLKRFPNLWVDNSGFCTPVRFKHLPVLANDPIIRDRTLYGSDWPVPSNAAYYLGRMPMSEIIRLERLSNPQARDVALKRYFGYPEASLVQANQVLANLDRWINRATPFPEDNPSRDQL